MPEPTSVQKALGKFIATLDGDSLQAGAMVADAMRAAYPQVDALTLSRIVTDAVLVAAQEPTVAKSVQALVAVAYDLNTRG